MRPITLGQLGALGDERAKLCMQYYDVMFEHISKKNSEAYADYFPDPAENINEFADKTFALYGALTKGVFFRVDMGSEGGMLNIRQVSEKSNKTTSLRFDVRWGKEDGVDAGHPIFGDIEKKLYPLLTRSLENIEIIDDRMSEAPLQLNQNQVKLGGALTEKCLSSVVESKDSEAIFAEMKGKRFVLDNKKEQTNPLNFP
jgi:hypothetical protein